MVVAAPEQCDDGNVDEWDGCLTDCTFGPGTKAALGLPDKLGGEEMYWFAGVPAQFIEANTHGLVIGGRVVDYLPDQIAAHVTLVPIPDGGPALWSYLEVAGMYGRVPGPMATAADGSVVMAGQVYTEQQNVDSGGYQDGPFPLIGFEPLGQRAVSLLCRIPSPARQQFRERRERGQRKLCRV